jgi:hypothetical protein
MAARPQSKKYNITIAPIALPGLNGVSIGGALGFNVAPNGSVSGITSVGLVIKFDWPGGGKSSVTPAPAADPAQIPADPIPFDNSSFDDAFDDAPPFDDGSPFDDAPPPLNWTRAAGPSEAGS